MTKEVPSVILAGGRSSRFDGSKAHAKLAGVPLVEHVLAKLELQSNGPIGLNTNAPELFDLPKVPRIEDRAFLGQGPLTGILTALNWAKAGGFEDVVTVTVDTPFLPDNLLRKLTDQSGPTIASSGDKRHPVCGCWPVQILPALTEFLSSGARAAMAWSEHCGAREVAFECAGGMDPFFNINNRSDLLAAERSMSV